MAALDLDQRIGAERAIDAALTAWAGSRSAPAAAEALLKAGIPAAALARSGDLAKSPHLAARDFWDRHGADAARTTVARQFRPHDSPRAGIGRGS